MSRQELCAWCRRPLHTRSEQLLGKCEQCHADETFYRKTKEQNEKIRKADQQQKGDS